MKRLWNRGNSDSVEASEEGRWQIMENNSFTVQENSYWRLIFVVLLLDYIGCLILCFWHSAKTR